MSKRLRGVFFMGIVMILLIAIASDNFALKPVRKHLIDTKQRGPDGSKYHNKTFVVVNVVDGDTFDIDIPDGESDITRIRPLGIDTPETKHPDIPEMYYGRQAFEHTEGLLKGNTVTIIIDTEGKSRDIYGRLLCYVQLSDGRDFSRVMIEDGYAYADLRFEHSRYEQYADYQQQAIENQAGLWKEVSVDQLPKWLRQRSPNILENMN